MSTEAIYNYRKVNDRIITGGQPQEAQLQSAAEEGYTVIINLATSGRSSLPDEAGLVRSLGMTYHHIPVDWNNPQESDFDYATRQLGHERLATFSNDLKSDGHFVAFFKLFRFSDTRFERHNVGLIFRPQSSLPHRFANPNGYWDHSPAIRHSS